MELTYVRIKSVLCFYMQIMVIKISCYGLFSLLVRLPTRQSKFLIRDHWVFVHSQAQCQQQVHPFIYIPCEKVNINLYFLGFKKCSAYSCSMCILERAALVLYWMEVNKLKTDMLFLISWNASFGDDSIDDALWREVKNHELQMAEIKGTRTQIHGIYDGVLYEVRPL